MSLAPPRRVWALLALVAILCSGLLLSPVEPAGADRAGGSFFVPTGKRTGFGAFQEGPHAAARLRHAFGPPTSERAGAYSDCLMKWGPIGVNVELTAFGTAKDACAEGTFVFARLTDPRWHTASGVRPGGSRASAQRASLLRCHAGTFACAATGYALELHRSDCSSALSAGVIAHPRGGRIAALNVYWRSCE
ncbi:MAG: hypothetical protein ACOYD4_15665 [Solirubrobacterales bacterium]